VPLTVKFSEDFYRKLGHETVDELVNWFNQVDSTYRGDLRELNEQNFARFDAKLEQRVTQLDAKLAQGLAEVRADLQALRAKLEQRVAEVKAELLQEIASLRTEMAKDRGEFRAQLEAQGKVIVYWMVGLWITAIGVLGGLIFAAVRFLPLARP
jgi:ABC-type phosphate transport system auxiliary subunit